jgi:hypothetical protein
VRPVCERHAEIRRCSEMRCESLARKKRVDSASLRRAHVPNNHLRSATRSLFIAQRLRQAVESASRPTMRAGKFERGCECRQENEQIHAQNAHEFGARELVALNEVRRPSRTGAAPATICRSEVTRAGAPCARPTQTTRRDLSRAVREKPVYRAGNRSP